MGLGNNGDRVLGAQLGLASDYLGHPDVVHFHPTTMNGPQVFAFISLSDFFADRKVSRRGGTIGCNTIGGGIWGGSY